MQASRAAVAKAAEYMKASDAHLRSAQSHYAQIGASGHAARLHRELDRASRSSDKT